MRILEQYVYICSNRRAECPVVEQLIAFDADELAAIAAMAADAPRGLVSSLETLSREPDPGAMLRPAPEREPCRRFGELYANCALLLQRAAGHRVHHLAILTGESPGSCRAIYEYEHHEVGVRAGELALLLLQRFCFPFDWRPEALDPACGTAELLREFRLFAAPLALPADTQAIVRAAAEAGVPCLRMDRTPFQSRTGDFRLRPNGLLKLGHGRRQHIVDGTFCVDRSEALAPLLRDRAAILGALERLGLPTPARDPETANCSTLSRAQRCARRIGYPLALRPALKTRGRGVSLGIRDADALGRAFAAAREHGRSVVVERCIAGASWKLVLANRELVGIVRLAAGEAPALAAPWAAHPSLVASAEAAARALDAGLLVLTLVCPDIALPLAASGGAFVDLDVAPRLDDFLAPDSPLLRSAAARFVAWLFPPGAEARIPIVAVTGTNGKTTTSRMIHRMLLDAGRASGLACSDGVYVGDRLLCAGDLAGVPGHYRLLEHPAVGCAVLETARGGVATMGIAYEQCAVAVCLNVTPDHLEHSGIHSLEQMAQLKRTVLERAVDGAVVNADDPLCLAMPAGLRAKTIVLVSMRRSVGELRHAHPCCTHFALLEHADGAEWIVLHDRGARMPVMPVAEIPATFDGLARYNVSNALHAIAAGYLSGIGVAAMRASLARFRMSFEDTPGRMNFHDAGGLRFLVDYAHNPDGIAKLCEFVDRLQPAGRKLLAFSAAGYNPEAIIADTARAAAGHFNAYVCYNRGKNCDQGYFEVPHILASALRASGVPPGRVFVEERASDAFDTLCRMAQPGDLVVLLAVHGEMNETWARVVSGDFPAIGIGGRDSSSDAGDARAQAFQ